MKSIKFVAAFLAAMLSLAPARASVVQVLFSGTLDSAVFYGTQQCQAGQPCGMFNSIYPGLPYTATFLFDTTLGTHYPSPEEIVGSGLQSPSLGAVVNIAGQMFNIAGSNFGDLGFGSVSGGGHSFGAIAQDVYPGGYGSAQITQLITNFTSALPTSLSAPFTYTLQPGDAGVGFLTIQDFHIQNFPGNLNGIAFIIDSVTYSVDPVATPVPGAGLLFASGLGGLGLLNWRRKKKSSSTRCLIRPKADMSYRTAHVRLRGSSRHRPVCALRCLEFLAEATQHG